MARLRTWDADAYHRVSGPQVAMAAATVYRSARDIRVLHADEALEVGDVVTGWSPRVGAFFG